MANYQNGQTYHGQPTNPQQSQPVQYGGYVPQIPGQEQTMRRTSSFDAGDDSPFFDESRGQNHPSAPQAGNGGAYAGYGVRNNLGSQHSQHSQTSSVPQFSPPPARTGSYGSPLTGYQHQYQQQPAPPSQPQYNPQQYARPQSQYTPQAYGSGVNSTASSYGSGYQPYVPAAYQTPTVQQQSAFSPGIAQHSTFSSQPYPQSPPGQLYSSNSVNYGAPTPMQSASVPQRIDEPPYISRRNTTEYAQDPYFRQNAPPPQAPGSAPLPPRPSAYSPPITAPQSIGPQPSSTFQPAQGRPHSSSLSYFASHPGSGRNTDFEAMPPTPEEHHPPPPNYSILDDASQPPQPSSSFASRMGRRPDSALPPIPQNSAPAPHLSPRRTDTLSRHPQERPLPGPPESESDSEYFDGRNGSSTQRRQEDMGFEDLMKEVESEINAGRVSGTQRSPGGRAALRPSTGPTSDPAPLFASSESSLSPDPRNSNTNGHISATGTGEYVNYEAYSDDSDAEAAAGLAAMRMAEEQDAAEDARRRSNTGSSMFSSTFGSSQPPPPPHQAHGDVSSDSDYGGADVGLLSGGYDANMHYGDVPIPGQVAPGPARFPSQQSIMPSGNSSSSALEHSSMYDYPLPDQDAIHPFRSFGLGARVDTGGTGGLSEPTPDGRKLSFDDGDEATLADSDIAQTSGSQSPVKDDFKELFYHPGMSSNRPLPPAPTLMPAGIYQPERGYSYSQYSAQGYPNAPDAYSAALLSPTGSAVPRSSSLSSHSNTPQTIPPIRSKTDAEIRARLTKQGLRSAGDAGYDSSVPPSATTLDLPTIPAGKRKKFNPLKLSNNEYKKCTEPWALSDIVAWIRDLSEDETDLRTQTLVDGFVALFTNKVPTMNTADAETLSARVVDEMLESGVLVEEEEWVKFGQGTMTGVLYQLTGAGCYSQRLHTYEMPGRCYSHHCMRTLKKVNLSAQVAEPQRKTEDWSTFYKVSAEDREKHGKKEVLLQNNLHEIVTSEDLYMEHLEILRLLYRDQLVTWQPPIIKADRIQKFTKAVFGKVDAVKKVNEDYLLAQLKYRQQEQGPWITGFSDIFREWIRKSKGAYIEYAASFPNANFLVRREAERNVLFKQFLDQVRDNKQSQRLSWDTFLKAPITRLQRYTLLLATVHKNMVQDSEEKMNLLAAITEIRNVTLECDAKVAEMSKKVDLDELSTKLQLRKEMRDVDLRLQDLGREIIYRGDLQRTGNNRFTWLDTHAILFDHFLVLAKTNTVRDAVGGLKYERYDVSKVPIPMDLLVLESVVDDAIQKSSVKGIGAVTTMTTKAPTPQDARLSRAISTVGGGGPGPGTLTHTKTDSSLSSVASVSSGRTIVTNTVLEGPKDEKVMYPFRVKHLGKSEIYTLYAPTAQNRQDWCDKIIEAKTRHAASLFAQNAEPFRLRVLADAAFAYDSMSGSPKSLLIKGTPLDRAIRQVEKDFATSGRPGPVCRAAVNCATTFNQPYGRLWCAVGTDYGVYISEYNNPRGWTRAIQISRVTQIAVLEEFSLFILIADKALIAYHLDVVCPITGVSSPNDSSRRAPQKLSGARDIGFFAIGRMKDRSLVFYKKKEGISSIFKVLEPVLQKSTTMRPRFLPSATRRGQTEFFREFDEFYIPTDCFSIHLFHSSLAIATSRGVEVLTLDKKQTWTVPNLKSDLPDVQTRLSSIASMLKDIKPLGMFRLGEAEFLVAFEECAVYVNKHGDVSRSVVMYFSGRAKGACLAGKYLVLFNDDFVEVRNANDGRLKQVIAGKDVKCLDDGGGGSGAAHPASGLGGGINGLGLAGVGAGPRTVKISMQHPEYERSQIVLELIENEGQKE